MKIQRVTEGPILGSMVREGLSGVTFEQKLKDRWNSNDKHILVPKAIGKGTPSS